MKYFGAALRSIIPQPEFKWPAYLAAEGYGTISKSVYDAYVSDGGTMSDKQAFDGYNAYALDEWNGCEGYSMASGNSPYHWGQRYPQAESFAEWLEVERTGKEHKYNWRW